MVALLTLEDAKQHLRVTFTDDDDDITKKIEEASDIVVNYIGALDDDWTETTVPPRIRSAIKLMLSELYANREAGSTTNEVAMGYLPVAVTSLLHRDRDPALA